MDICLCKRSILRAMENPLRQYPPLMKLLTVAFVALASFGVFLIIGLLTGSVFFGVGMDEYNQAMQQAGTYPGYMKYMQAMYSIGIFVVPAFILGRLFFAGPGDKLGLHTSRLPYGTTVILAIILVVAAMPFINILASWNASLNLPDSMQSIEQWMREMENQAMGLTENLLSGTTLTALLVNLLVVALIPAVGEEFLFRGIVQPVFFQMTRSPHAAVWLAALLFSFLHFQFFGFLPRLILGVMFGYLLVWSKTIWVPVIAHFANNGLAVIFYYLYNQGAVGSELERVGTQNYQVIYLLGSALMLAAVMAAIFHSERILRSQEQHARKS